MHHPSTETILQYMEARAETGAAREAHAEGFQETEAHLGRCERCRAHVQELGALVGFLEEDRSNEPDPAALDQSLKLFQPVIRAGRESRGRRLLEIARCVFDSYSRPVEGVRDGGILPRQLLYRAGPVDVDLRIEASGGRTSLLGQLLSEAGSFPAETEVRLEAAGEIRSRTSTNAVGEFSFPDVPPEPFHLALDLPEGEVRLFCVNRPTLT
jgi:hypothetical protein